MSFNGIPVVFPNIKIALFPKVRFVLPASCVCIDLGRLGSNSDVLGGFMLY